MKRKKLLMTAIVSAAMLVSGAVNAAAAGDTVQVVCVGDSLTESRSANYGTDGVTNIYPDKLAEKLGDGYSVLGCGKSGATIHHYRAGYIGTAEYKRSISVVPDYVAIMFGTNDVNVLDFTNDADKKMFADNYERIVKRYRELNSKVRIIMMTPPPIDTGATDNAGMVEKNWKMDTLVGPFVEELASQLGCDFLDMYPIINEKWPNGGAWYDGVHFTEAGYDVIAQTVCDRIKNIENDGEISADYISDGKISVISDKAMTSDIYVGAYDAGGKVVNTKFFNDFNVMAYASNVLDVAGIRTADTKEIKLFWWAADGSMKPIAAFNTAGERVKVTGGGTRVSGASFAGVGRVQAMAVSDESGNLIFADQAKIGQTGIYDYTVPNAGEGNYTLYTESRGGAITEAITVIE